MIWIMTMARRMNGVYAAFMLVAFMMGVAGALQAPTLSLFLSREVGAQPFWIGLFYTVNAIAGIGVSLWLAKRSDRTSMFFPPCGSPVISVRLIPCKSTTAVLKS